MSLARMKPDLHILIGSFRSRDLQLALGLVDLRNIPVLTSPCHSDIGDLAHDLDDINYSLGIFESWSAISHFDFQRNWSYCTRN